jgi:Mycotoxin biosynthesis protein UstYa
MIKVELMRQEMRLPTPKHAKDTMDHIPHCFDYIRQGLMCNADTTLEKSIVVDGIIMRDVTGWDVQHECRDWDAIMKWSADRRTDNSKFIIPPYMGLYAGLQQWPDYPVEDPSAAKPLTGMSAAKEDEHEHHG